MISRARLKKTGFTLPDLLAFGFLLGFLVSILVIMQNWAGPLEPPAPIELTIRSLPSAMFYSLGRIMLSYFVCLITSLVIGYWAAHSKLAETIIIPVIDIGQSIPVLGFLPGLVIFFVYLFPHSRMGLEIAAILTLYTTMAWNLMLSFYGSIKTIPRDYVEIIKAYGYGRIGVLLRLEIPIAMNGIIWNSMLSIAGGWFFLTFCESFTLGDKSFRLYGMGSYMSLASDRGDWTSLIAGGFSVILILVVMDFFIWNPLLRWSERFQRMQPLTDEEDEEPVLNFFAKSQRITQIIRKIRRRYAVKLYVNKRKSIKRSRLSRRLPFLAYGILALGFLFAVFGLIGSMGVLRTISLSDWGEIIKNTFYTFMRVNAVLVLSTVLMVPTGLWLGAHPRFVKKLKPVIQVIAAFPAPMIFSALMVIFLKLSLTMEIGSILLMMTGAQWYLLFNVISAAASVPESLVEVARTTGLTEFQIMRKVYFPAAFPQILTGLITAAGGAWNTSIAAELVVYQNKEYGVAGIGAYIFHVSQQEKYPELIAALVVMIVVIVVINRLFWARLYDLAESRYRLD